MIRLLLVGLPGADWATLPRRLAGLPFLRGLVERGVAGPLRCPPPLGDGPAPWAALATGRHAEAHGVLLPTEVRPDGGGLRPASARSWRAAPLWSQLEAAGLRAGVVAWPAAAPAVAWPGLHVDASFAAATGRDAQGWALPRRCVTPELRGALRDLRLHPTEIDAETPAGFVPGMAQVDQARDTALAELAVLVAEAATVHAAATWLAEHRAPDALMVHYGWLARLVARFEGAAPPLDGVVAAAWRFQDAMLARLAALAGPGAAVVVVAPAGPGQGLLAATGPGIAGDSLLHGAGVLDVAPTLLARFGLADEEAPGRVLPEIAPRGPANPAPAPPCLPPEPDNEAAVRALAAQGYPDTPDRDALLAQQAAHLAALAVALLPRDPGAAERAAEAALGLSPDSPGPLATLALAKVALGDAEALRPLGERLRRAAPDRCWGALALGAHHALRGEAELAAPFLGAAEAAGEANVLLRVGAAWLVLARSADAERVMAAALALDPLLAEAATGLGLARHMAGDLPGAEAALRRALVLDHAPPLPRLYLGAVLLDAGRLGEAAAMLDAAERVGADRATVAGLRRALAVRIAVTLPQ